MEVLVWKGDFGLPTAHPAGLSLVTYLKFSGRTFHIVQKSNAFFTKTGEFPILKRAGKEYGDEADIRKYLQSEMIDLDHFLQPKEKSEAFAYKVFIENSLRPCFEYSWWVDEQNYDETVRSWFAKSITFPFNFYYPGKFQKRAEQLIDVIYDEHSYEKHEIRENVYKTADECFKCFSDKLGRNEFIFGKKPCSLDAVLFGYLAPILKVPLKNPVISNKLKAYDNLVKYVNRICQMFYRDAEIEYAAANKNKTSTQKTDPTKVEVNYTRHTVFAIVFASLAMLGYAHSNGLLSNTWNEDTSPYIFDEADEDDS